MFLKNCSSLGKASFLQKKVLPHLTSKRVRHRFLNYKTNDNITGYIEIFNYTGNIIFNSQIILYYDYKNKKIIHYLND